MWDSSATFQALNITLQVCSSMDWVRICNLCKIRCQVLVLYCRNTEGVPFFLLLFPLSKICCALVCNCWNRKQVLSAAQFIAHFMLHKIFRSFWCDAAMSHQAVTLTHLNTLRACVLQWLSGKEGCWNIFLKCRRLWETRFITAPVYKFSPLQSSHYTRTLLCGWKFPRDTELISIGAPAWENWNWKCGILGLQWSIEEV